MARGGRRAGIQGRNYAQRSDLTMNARPLPVMTTHNQQYGAASQQIASQQAVPMASGPLHPVPPSAPSSSAGAPGGGTPNPVRPGGLGDFAGPTNRPGEPISHGAALGPGPGPESLAPPTMGGAASMAAMLATMAATSGDRQLMLFAQQAASLASG